MAHLQEAAIKKVHAICDRYEGETTPLIMILSDVQKEFGYVPMEVQEIISARTGISVAEIYGVVTFYSQFSLFPKGKYQVSVCLGTACYVKGSGEIFDELVNLLGIDNGEVTPDRKFSLDATRCVGCCGLAPVMCVNGEVYGKITAKDVKGIIEKYN